MQIPLKPCLVLQSVSGCSHLPDLVKQDKQSTHKNIGALMSHAGSQSLPNFVYVAHTKPLFTSGLACSRTQRLCLQNSTCTMRTGPTNNQPLLTEQSDSTAGLA